MEDEATWDAMAEGCAEAIAKTLGELSSPSFNLVFRLIRDQIVPPKLKHLRIALAKVNERPLPRGHEPFV